MNTSIDPLANIFGPSTSISAIKLPQFYMKDATVWFTFAESAFETNIPKITASQTKYHYVVQHLPIEAASIVRDILLKPPTRDPYDVLKQALIDQTSASASERLKQLLSEVERGDRKPSIFLRSLQAKADGHNLLDKIMRELFLQRLPKNIQEILATSTADLDELGRLADKILEVSASSTSVSAVTNTDATEMLLSKIEKLENQMTALLLRYNGQRTFRRNERSHSRNHSISRSRNSFNKQFCWYHNKFGEKATKCTHPCTFSKN